MKVTLPEHFITHISQKSTLGFSLIADLKFIQQIMLEALGFFIIIFSHYMLLVYKNTVKYVNAPGIVSAYFVANMFLIEKTGAGLNPGRILGLGMMTNYY